MKTKQKIFAVVAPIVSLCYLTVCTATLTARTAASESATADRLVAQAPVDSSIERVWQSEDNNLRVKISKENNVYNGKIVWLAPGAETKDVKNPDPKLRDRNLMGVTTFKGFKYNPGKKEWAGGTVYAVAMGRTVRPKISLAGVDRLKLGVRVGPFSRTFTLTAVQ